MSFSKRCHGSNRGDQQSKLHYQQYSQTRYFASLITKQNTVLRGKNKIKQNKAMKKLGTHSEQRQSIRKQKSHLTYFTIKKQSLLKLAFISIHKYLTILLSVEQKQQLVNLFFNLINMNIKLINNQLTEQYHNNQIKLITHLDQHQPSNFNYQLRIVMQSLSDTKHSQKYANLESQQLFELLKVEYDNMRLDNAHQIVLVLNSKKQLLEDEVYKLIQRVEIDYADMLKAIELLNIDSSKWPTTKIGNKKHSGTIANKVYGMSGIQAQIKGQFEVNGTNLAILVHEDSLFSQWVPFCCQSKLIHQVSYGQKFVFVKFGFPYLATRQIIFFGQAIDRYEHNGTLLIHMRGVTGNEKYQKRYGVKLASPIKKGTEFFSQNIVIEMNIKQPVYKFRTYSNVDLQVLYIPQFAVNFFAGKIGNFAFINVVERAASFKGTQWEKRIKEDKDGFYKKLNEKLKEWNIDQQQNA